MKKALGIAVVLVLFLCRFTGAQDNKDLVSYYDSELCQFSYNMFGGLTLNYRNQTASTQFGIPGNMKSILYAYPDSKASVQSYSKLNLAGNILFWGGMAAAFAGSYYPLFTTDSFDTTDDWTTRYKVSLGLAIGGLVSTLVGAFLLPASLEKLCQGVNSYNRLKISEYR